jgi:hypothetical protein
VNSVVVPVEPLISGDLRPPVNVSLPLDCRPQRAVAAAYGLFLTLPTVMFGAVAAAQLWAGGRPGLLVTVLVFAASVWCSIALGALAVSCLAAALRPGPAVTIDEVGFEDLRLKLCLDWSEISQLEFRNGGTLLALRTHDGQPTRAGLVDTIAFRRRGDQIIIRMNFLSPSWRVSAVAMAMLVERAGGEVKGMPYWV